MGVSKKEEKFFIEKSDEKFLCKICGKSYNAKKQVAGHISSRHRFQPVSCPTCGKSFQNKKCS